MLRKGAKPYRFTDKQRREVKRLVLAGFTNKSIAAIIGIDKDTFVKHFKEEIHAAREKMTGKIVDAVLKKALAGDLASAKFWLKTRGIGDWQEEEQRRGDDYAGELAKRVQEARDRVLVKDVLIDLVKTDSGQLKASYPPIYEQEPQREEQVKKERHINPEGDTGYYVDDE